MTFSSPLVGEEGARAAQPRGKVRGNVDGLTKRQLLPALTPFRSRELRRNSTEAEKQLWRALRESVPTAKFRRQVPLGPYFADFASHAARLVIEVDGGQHEFDKDANRTAFIQGEGYTVLRFWNHEVLQNLSGVLERIAAMIPSPLVGRAESVDERHVTLSTSVRGGAKRRMRGSR